nr:MAG TPA: hypothetical protein [Caudoviricetes sp.]
MTQAHTLHPIHQTMRPAPHNQTSNPILLLPWSV